MGKAELVPFGKYKGQPVEALAQDRAYCDWLTGQEWFRTRYATIHTLIINNFGEPTETPEHNALQAKFTDRTWIEGFCRAYFRCRGSEFPTAEFKIQTLQFEDDGADVDIISNYGWWRIECKPALGDDYPAVLRQMRMNRAEILLIGDGGYTGVGATFEQVRQIFASSRRTIVMLSEIE